MNIIIHNNNDNRIQENSTASSNNINQYSTPLNNTNIINNNNEIRHMDNSYNIIYNNNNINNNNKRPTNYEDEQHHSDNNDHVKDNNNFLPYNALEQQQQQQQQQYQQQHHEMQPDQSHVRLDNNISSQNSYNNNNNNHLIINNEHKQEEQHEEQHEQHGRIHKIDTQSIQRIVAGQAVTDLASAVKELVDNALDAASQSINIRLFNKGIDIIEVTDDGIGVPINSRPYLALPHATSKIRTFEDIYHCPDDSDDEDEDNDDENDNDDHDSNCQDDDDDDDDDELPSSTLTTMGFRGEALFCLSNLSNKLIIATRTSDEDIATKMEFRKDGSLDQTNITYIPRKIGTTVAIIKLFDTIPVRRNDMIRRIKYQRSKLMNIIEGYAIFSIGVRIHLIDMIHDKITGNIESKSLLSTTTNNKNIQETVSSILGSKFLMNMSNVDIDLTSIVIDTSSNLTNNNNNNDKDVITSTTDVNNTKEHNNDDDICTNKKKKNKYKLHGLISKAGTIHHRGVRQGQFFSINRRPVDLPKVARLINDTWRSFGSSSVASNISSSSSSQQQSQTPSFVLQFVLPNNAYDINLSPDKRQVIFTNETMIFQLVQNGLIQLWKSQTDGKFIINNKNNNNNDLMISTTKQCKITRDIYMKDDDANEEEDDDEEIVNNTFGMLVENDKHTTNNIIKVDRNENNNNELEEDEFIASRRYGFADDPTMAISREVEDRIRRHQYLANQQQQQQVNNNSRRDQIPLSSNTIINNNEIQMIIENQSSTSEEMVPDEGKDIMIQDNEDFGIDISNERSSSSSSQVFISPSPLQLDRGCSTLITKGFALQTQTNNDEDEDIDGELYTSTTSRIEDLRAAYNETKQWQDVVKKFNSPSSSIERDDDPMNETIKHLNQVKPRNLMTSDITMNEISNDQNDEMITGVNNNEQQHSGTKRKMFGLEKFGFRSVKRESNVNEIDDRRIIETSLVSSSQTKLQYTNEEITKNSSYVTNTVYQSNRRQRIVSLPETRSDDSYIQQPDHESSVLKSSLISKGKESNDYSSGNNNTEEISDNSSPTTVVWKAAMSTEAVINATIRERLAMYERRMQFRKTNVVDLQQSITDTFQQSIEENDDGTNIPNGSRSVSLSKEDFRSIKILGQFNLGFILASTHDGNVWILDQHACDEKYNFEKLIKDTVIHEQPLIAPMSLELSPVEEACVLENMEIFEKNGFRFKFDPLKPIRHRLSLTALPHSGAVDGRKAVQFGVDDVVALCDILTSSSDDTDASGSYMGGGTGVDGSGKFTNNAVKRQATQSYGDNADRIIVRLPKAIAMFASRACRGSIMIGKALSEKEMIRIVNRLADVEHPWNCPHGRPTLRHLIDIKTMIENDEKVAAEHVAGPTVTILSQDEED